MSLRAPDGTLRPLRRGIAPSDKLDHRLLEYAESGRASFPRMSPKSSARERPPGGLVVLLALPASPAAARARHLQLAFCRFAARGRVVAFAGFFLPRLTASRLSRKASITFAAGRTSSVSGATMSRPSILASITFWS